MKTLLAGWCIMGCAITAAISFSNPNDPSLALAFICGVLGYVAAKLLAKENTNG